ncbi:hypothetical protein JYQ62_26290 [Nostoc sp. UHCC 0702]|nr:hypothetical protein JYQ62_26290 [Nostoc sp. UHCC 0702]
MLQKLGRGITLFIPEDYRLESRGVGEQGSRGAGVQGRKICIGNLTAGRE